MNNQNHESLIEFLKSQEVRTNVVSGFTGIIIAVIGALFYGYNNNVSIIIQFIGAMIAFASTEQIIRKISKN